MKIEIKNQQNVEKMLQVLVDEGYNFKLTIGMAQVKTETIKIINNYIIEVEDENKN